MQNKTIFYSHILILKWFTKIQWKELKFQKKRFLRMHKTNKLKHFQDLKIFFLKLIVQSSIFINISVYFLQYIHKFYFSDISSDSFEYYTISGEDFRVHQTRLMVKGI